jgi:hypothetical protein
MSHDADRNPWGRVIVRETAATRPGATGWWIAAIVAVVVLVGLIVLANYRNRANEAQAAQAAGDYTAAQAQSAAAPA